MPGRRRSLATAVANIRRSLPEPAGPPGRWVKSLQGERLQTHRVVRAFCVIPGEEFERPVAPLRCYAWRF